MMKPEIADSTSCSKRKKGWTARIEGSVSIFLIMILAFVFLFVTVLIDYARIAAANAQGERLARAGVRSVLSAYDVELQEKYGLFAFGTTDGNMLLSKVMNENLRRSGRADHFNLIRLGIESSDLQWSRPLGEYDTFLRQIQEEMKYKAPIDFALELGGKFKPISGAMAEASRVTKVLTKLQPLYDKREEALDVMMNKRQQAAESGRTLLLLIMNPPRDHLGASTLGEVSTAGDIAAQYDDYLYKYTEDMNRDSREPARYTYPLSRYAQQSATVLNRLPQVIHSFYEQHNRLLGEAAQALQQAKEFNEQMKDVLTQARHSGDNATGQDRDWDIPGSSENGVDSDPLRKLREQEDVLILGEAVWQTIEGNLARQQSVSDRAEPEVSQMTGVLAGYSGLYSDGPGMINTVLGAARTMRAYLDGYGNGGNILADEKAVIESHRSSDKQRKQWEKEAKAKLSDAMKLLDKIRELGGRAGEAMQRYDILNQYYEESLSFNRESGEGVDGAENSSNPYKAGNAAMTNMDNVYGMMDSVISGARDRLFQTEYASLYFQHFDVSALTSLAAGIDESSMDRLAAQMDPHAQELEYLLYGFHNPAGNIAAAYGEIFAMRLAIRTMEGLIKNAGAGHPLAVLAASLLYGIEQTVQDMLKLCKDGSIPLSAYIPAQLTYRDHLRLFLLIHGSNETQLSRMLALIRLHTGINPAEKHTYASASIRFGLKLWFLPGIIKLLNYSEALPGEVEGRVYYKSLKADFAY